MLEQKPQIVQNNFHTNKETFTINGAQVESIDLKPDNQKDEVPVLIAPGHSATKESVRPGLEVLAKKGRRSISFDHPRKGGTSPESDSEQWKEWCKKKGLDCPKWSSEELRKANTILGLLEQKKLDKVDVIAYSEGAINICIAATLHPEKFTDRTIVLYSPAGLIGKDTLLRLAKGVRNHPKRPESLSHIPITETEIENKKMTSQEASNYKKANRIRSFKEGVAISQARIENMLQYLHEKGTRIFVIQGVDDTFFPIDRMQKIVQPENTEDNFVDGFLPVVGGHVQIQIHPELYMDTIDKMLDKPKTED